MLAHFNAVLVFINRINGLDGEVVPINGDDFISVAEYLIQAGYTRPKRLAIYGKEGEGQLVTAVGQRRPNLFAATVSENGTLDPLVCFSCVFI